VEALQRTKGRRIISVRARCQKFSVAVIGSTQDLINLVMRHPQNILLSFLLGLFSLPILASSHTEVEQILSMRIPPFGVVFEIAESDADALDWAIPEVNGYVKKLRSRFPDIGIAVVTHGNEQFALMSGERSSNQAVHDGVAWLVSDDVPVHVCGTNASWRGKTPEDFPEYVDVTPAGPTEIRNYQAMGYQLVRVRER
jgi:intracellular sulfur oxidation DsrE/DsrF family protein